MPIHSEKAIRFFFLSKNITLKNRRALKSFLSDLISKEGKTLGFVNYIFCSDNYLLTINKEYLSHDDYTDIITFDLSSSPRTVEAEIYISVDRIKENAKQLKIPVQKEILRVMFHGLLHIFGHRDKTQKEKAAMRKLEETQLKRFLR